MPLLSEGARIHTTSSIYKEKPTMYQDEELLYEVRGPKKHHS